MDEQKTVCRDCGDGPLDGPRERCAGCLEGWEHDFPRFAFTDGTRIELHQDTKDVDARATATYGAIYVRFDLADMLLRACDFARSVITANGVYELSEKLAIQRLDDAVNSALVGQVIPPDYDEAQAEEIRQGFFNRYNYDLASISPTDRRLLLQAIGLLEQQDRRLD